MQAKIEAQRPFEYQLGVEATNLRLLEEQKQAEEESKKKAKQGVNVEKIIIMLRIAARTKCLWDDMDNTLSDIANVIEAWWKRETAKVVETKDDQDMPERLDYEGNGGDYDAVQKALEELGFHTESLNILGVYEASLFRQKK